MRYFETYQQAQQFIKNAGLNVKPVKKSVWIYPSWDNVWAVPV